MMTIIFELDFYLNYSDNNYQAPLQFDIFFRVYHMDKYLVSLCFIKKLPLNFCFKK